MLPSTTAESAPVQEGHGAAAGILDEAAVHLGAIALAVLHRLGDLPVYSSGAIREGAGSLGAQGRVSDNPLNWVFLIAREELVK